MAEPAEAKLASCGAEDAAAFFDGICAQGNDVEPHTAMRDTPFFFGPCLRAYLVHLLLAVAACLSPAAALAQERVGVPAAGGAAPSSRETNRGPTPSEREDTAIDLGRDGPLAARYVHAPDLSARTQVIAAGDVVRVLMIEDPTVAYEGPVSASGTVLVPFYGEFEIAGLTQAEASKKLGEELQKDLYQTATVSVVLLARGPGTVFLYGAVNNPGGVSIPRYGQLTILRLILLSGGTTGWAALEDAFVLRYNRGTDKVERISVKLNEVFASAIPSSERDMPLVDGDIVCVPGVNGELFEFMSAGEREIMIIGEVKGPGMIRFAPGERRTLMRALFKAGGFTQFAKKDAVHIIRYEKNQERSELVVDAEEIMEKGQLHKDVDVNPGDLIMVPQKVLNF